MIKLTEVEAEYVLRALTFFDILGEVATNPIQEYEQKLTKRIMDSLNKQLDEEAPKYD